MSECMVFHRFVFVLFWKQTHAHKKPLQQQLKNTLSFASPSSYAVSSSRYPDFFFKCSISKDELKRFLSHFGKQKAKSIFLWLHETLFFSSIIIPCQLPSSRMELAYECNEWRKYGKKEKYGSAINCRFFKTQALLLCTQFILCTESWEHIIVCIFIYTFYELRAPPENAENWTNIQPVDG